MAKGYNKVLREDYSESFSPVAKATIVRLFLAMGVAKQCGFH